MSARYGRARGAAGSTKNETRIHLSSDALRFVDPGDIDKLSGDGPAVPAESKLCHPERLDNRRESGLSRAQEIWRACGRQQRRLFFDLDLPGRSVFVNRVQQSFHN